MMKNMKRRAFLKHAFQVTVGMIALQLNETTKFFTENENKETNTSLKEAKHYTVADDLAG